MVLHMLRCCFTFKRLCILGFQVAVGMSVWQNFLAGWFSSVHSERVHLCFEFRCFASQTLSLEVVSLRPWGVL
jgi:hypothetical protein